MHTKLALLFIYACSALENPLLILYKDHTDLYKSRFDNATDITELLAVIDDTRPTLVYWLQQLRWNYNTNMTEENLAATRTAMLYDSSIGSHRTAAIRRIVTVEALKSMTETQTRAIRPHLKMSHTLLSKRDRAELFDLKSAMQRVYSTVKVNDKAIDPHLVDFMAKNRTQKKLDYYWKEWNTRVGVQIKPNYARYVRIMNKIARLSNFDDAADMWLSSYCEPALDYTSTDLIAEVDDIWKTVRPLYKKLHAYVRHKLQKVYPDIPKNDTIPSNLLGNMWAQSWENIHDLVEPYPSENIALDVTREMIRQNYTAERMFKMAEEFFISLGAKPVPRSFWVESMFTQPKWTDVVCQASSWNMDAYRDVRIKMCTSITHADFVVVHHEMGHIYYYLTYNGLNHSSFKNGAQPGFHEAIGDTLQLSVSTPAHLKKIGLLDGDVSTSKEQSINYLMKMALQKVAFLPFGLLLDKYRWSIFDGTITPKNYQRAWHIMRKHFQGIHPISLGLNNFDAGAKFHVANGSPYMRYFASHILQFQFYRAMCVNHPRDRPLHECDFHGDHDAGAVLKRGLSLGASRPWQDILEIMTGDRRMSGDALLEYFAPLEDWLDNYIEKTGIPVGWSRGGSIQVL